jgi:hypothetical protein
MFAFLTEADMLSQSFENLKMPVFWDILPYSLVDTDWHLKETYCIHYCHRHHDLYLPVCMMLHLRRQLSSYSSPKDPQISSV